MAIQVRGCFWHQHAACGQRRVPASDVEYWSKKLARTVERDRNNDSALMALGWSLVVVWECELKSQEAVETVARSVMRQLHLVGTDA